VTTTDESWTCGTTWTSSGTATITYPSTYTYTVTGTWYTWGTTSSTVNLVPYDQDARPWRRTPEDEARQEERRVVLERERAARERAIATERAARQSADQKAEALLLSLLDDTTREHYQLHGVIEIIGSVGTRYRIKRGVSGNVYWLDGNREGGSFCCHPREGLPIPDVMLGQMLALQTDEPGFLALANLMSGCRPPVGV
jgi:hypothetical protein